MKRRIALVTTAAAFFAALLAVPAAAEPDVDPFRNFHWTGERDIQKRPWIGDHAFPTFP
ncbi:hypothetical protein [Nonomuraea sp. NPDC048826]|uniref:hypothetical protein n=1 Tax=Nonomuraea sp. NPDC048826 TaxID=3364347 RepID=UPI003711DF28